MIEPLNPPARVWRPLPVGGLFIAGQTRHYAVEPAGNWVLGALTSGYMQACAARDAHLFQPGDLCVWPGDAAHQGQTADGDGWTARLIILDAELGSLIPRHTTHRLQDKRLFTGFLRLHDRSQQADDSTESELLEWLVELGDEQRDDRRSRAPSRAVRLARELLDDDVARPLSLDALAQVAASDKFHLAKMFKRELGVAPHRYLIGRRLTVAQQSLAAGASIADAAQAAGFFDQSHLSRHFVRRLGFTPAQFVRALGGQPRTYKT